MKKISILSFISLFILVGCTGNSKSTTQKRIQKQEKHRKKHDCPQLDC